MSYQISRLAVSKNINVDKGCYKKYKNEMAFSAWMPTKQEFCVKFKNEVPIVFNDAFSIFSQHGCHCQISRLRLIAISVSKETKVAIKNYDY